MSRVRCARSPSKAAWHMSAAAAFPGSASPISGANSRRSWQVESRWCRTASLSGVFPLASLSVTSACASSRNRTSGSWPSEAATCSADRFAWSTSLIWMSWSNAFWTASRFPVRHSRRNASIAAIFRFVLSVAILSVPPALPCSIRSCTTPDLAVSSLQNRRERERQNTKAAEELTLCSALRELSEAMEPAMSDLPSSVLLAALAALTRLRLLRLEAPEREDLPACKDDLCQCHGNGTAAR
eukprot:3025417-Rhodomonas_salina.1